MLTLKVLRTTSATPLFQFIEAINITFKRLAPFFFTKKDFSQDGSSKILKFNLY